jgi:predicted ATPase
MGYLEQAKVAAALARSRARQIGHAMTTAMTLMTEAMLGTIGGDLDRAAEQADELVAHSREHSFTEYETWGRIFRGLLQAQRSDVAGGIDAARQGMEGAQRIGSRVMRVQHLGSMAAVLAAAAKHEASLGQLDEALSLVATTEERWFEAELHRLRGEALLAMGSADTAEASLQHALTVARRQNSRLWELRAAMSLGRLWATQNRRAEARELIAPVYSWFTEGLETPDLKAAKSLLDELQTKVFP